MNRSIPQIHFITQFHYNFFVCRHVKMLILLAIICCHSVGYSQVIRGTVFDKNTAEVIPFASIYFSGTTLGTTSNEKGYFELSPPKDMSNPLIVSSVGFYSATLTTIITSGMLLVNLEPKTYNLLDIEVSGDESRNIRKRYFPIFRNEFLGKKINPKLCRIINEGDIMLQYDGNRKFLKAFANRPIRIQNKQLGYDIIYYLDRFEFSLLNKSLVFTGNYIFTPILAKDSKQQEEFEINRVNAYLGSRMHLFRSLWEDNLELSGFVAVNIRGEPIPPDKLRIGTITSPNGVPLKVLSMLGPFGFYYKLPARLTKMVVQNGMLPFDSNGYFDPMGIVWEGYMANKRISDLLPFEYNPHASALKKSKEFK